MASSSYQESQDEMKHDHFDRLLDDLVMLIINKLIHVKTFTRFARDSKHYSSLFNIDSLLVDLDLPVPSFLGRLLGFLRNLVAKFMRTSTPNIPSSTSKKISLIKENFQQLKHFHLHFPLDSSTDVSLESGSLKRWVAACGSQIHIEGCVFLIASSIVN